MSIFWLEDVRELYKNNNFLLIFPLGNMNIVQKLNSLTRLFLLLILIILLFRLNDQWLYFPIIGLIIIIIFYYTQISSKSKQEKFVKIKPKRIKKHRRIDHLDYKNDDTNDAQDLNSLFTVCSVLSINDTKNLNEAVPFNETDSQINDLPMDNYIDPNLFRDVDDVFEIENTKRQLQKLPNKGPDNDQTGFARWLAEPKN